MAIALGYEYDLFISYSHADDIDADGGDGWVSQFQRHLEQTLRQRLGGAEGLRIFFDNRAAGANRQLSELLIAVRKSALFLPVGSPSYAMRDWPHQELATFVEMNPDPSRLFFIECLPLSEDERYPAPLEKHLRMPFWKPAGRRQVPMPISAVSDPVEFATLIHSLASDIRERLITLRYAKSASAWERPGGSAAAPAGAFPTTGAGTRTVLVAQATDDVADESDQVLRYLGQYKSEVRVLPESTYPQGGEAFANAFQRDLEETDLFVQLLGRRIGRCPPDLPEGYTKFQMDAAKYAGIEIMQWRHPDLDIASVADENYLRILQGETVAASGLEAFKNQVLTWARKRPPAPPSTVNKGGPTIFINADDKDLPVAREIERECVQQALQTFLPISGASAAATRQDLADNLVDCDMLLFIYGDTTQDWIRGQLRFFGKVNPKRDTPPRLLAICYGPPTPKPDIGVSVPNAKVISCPETWDMAAIRELIRGVRV